MAKLGIVRIWLDGKNLDDMLSQYFTTLFQGRICGLCFVHALDRPTEIPGNVQRHNQWDLFRAMVPRWDSFFSVPPTHPPFSEEGIGLGILSRKSLTKPFRVLLPGGRLIAGAHRELNGIETVILTSQLGKNPSAEQTHVLLTLIQGQKQPVILALDSERYKEEALDGLLRMRNGLEIAGMSSIAESGIFCSRDLQMSLRPDKEPRADSYKLMMVEVSSRA